MVRKTKNKKLISNTIVLNRAARHDYFIEERWEAGIALEGWEVKALRAGRVNIKESYVFVKNNEAYISGLSINPLPTASSHVQPESTRLRKLLLHRDEISKLVGLVERKGYTLIATAMYWKRGRCKIEIASAKGKKQQDKRAVEKERDWKREQARLFKRS